MITQRRFLSVVASGLLMTAAASGLAFSQQAAGSVPSHEGLGANNCDASETTDTAG